MDSSRVPPGSVGRRPDDARATRCRATFRCGAALLVALTTLAAAPGRAFDEAGHRLICRLAFRQLQPAARSFVRRSLGTGRPSAFAEACAWADREGREHPAYAWLAPLHYLTAPYDAPDVDLEAHCAPSGCATSAILRFSALLEDPATLPEDRALALRMVAHLIADLHLPVHVAHPDGRGGNDTMLRFGSQTLSEHALWDQALLALASPSHDEGALLEVLAARQVGVGEPSAVAPTEESLLRWARESFGLAHQRALFVAASGDALDESRAKAIARAVERRAALAARRLAAVLNHLARPRAESR